ncbi:hypothetical protein BJ322DRAFT_700683 [Thelephora terrestris]|uniref:Uncharacterized protein n=1 Tax=Thelephora terrestris TaxID=56493 RepID=A0A9P6L8G2_9AGAM|nr:hypothetical protein BJ322DRAFT_700683 [Thelephora terrestris]
MSSGYRSTPQGEHSPIDSHELGFDDTLLMTPTLHPPSRPRLVLLSCLSSTFFLLLLLLPVVIPDDHTQFDFPRFGVNDLLRILDPFINYPLLYLLFNSARPAPSRTLTTLFALSSVLYIFGSTAHTMSALLKHSIEQIKASQGASMIPAVEEAYVYTRNVWEHIVGHYMYAAGVFFASVLIVVVHFRASYPPVSVFRGWMLVYSGTLSGILYALVSTQLPYAPLIGIVVFWSVAATIVFFLWKEGDLGIRRCATRPIPQIYAWSATVALILTIVWTAIKGIKGRNLD